VQEDVLQAAAADQHVGRAEALVELRADAESGPDRRAVADRVQAENAQPAPGGCEMQPIIRIVEDLPAPFGPRKPNASPARTSTSMPSTAVKPPNRFTRPRASMSG
jgi:hypothetical protein